MLDIPVHVSFSILQVRELASGTLAGLMKGAGSKLGEDFRTEAYDAAVSLQAATRGSKRSVCFTLLRDLPCVKFDPLEFHDMARWKSFQPNRLLRKKLLITVSDNVCSAGGGWNLEL